MYFTTKYPFYRLHKSAPVMWLVTQWNLLSPSYLGICSQVRFPQCQNKSFSHFMVVLMWTIWLKYREFRCHVMFFRGGYSNRLLFVYAHGLYFESFDFLISLCLGYNSLYPNKSVLRLYMMKSVYFKIIAIFDGEHLLLFPMINCCGLFVYCEDLLLWWF